MKVPDALNRVDTTSKLVALIFFLVLTLVGFFLGIWYERNLITSQNNDPAKVVEPVITPTPTMMPTATPTPNAAPTSTAKVTVKPTVAPTATPKPTATPTVQVNL